MQRGDPLVRTGQREQRIHQLGHAVDFLESLLQRGESLRRQVRRGDGALDAGPQHGEWCLELVTRVGREAAQRAEAPLEAGHHLVQRRGKAAQLVLHHRLGEAAVQAAAVRDLPDLGDDLIDGSERPAGDPGPDEQGSEEPDGQDQCERVEQLLRPELRRLDVGPGENGDRGSPDPPDVPHGVMEPRSARAEAHHARRRPAARRGDELPQLLHVLKGERPRIGGCEQQAVVRGRHDEVVGHHLEQRRHLGDQHQPAGGVGLYQDAAGAVRLDQDPGRELRLGADALVEVLVGGAAAGEVQHRGEGGEGERERRRVPGREPRADRLHVTPARRTRRRVPCESASARARGRSSSATA